MPLHLDQAVLDRAGRQQRAAGRNGASPGSGPAAAKTPAAGKEAVEQTVAFDEGHDGYVAWFAASRASRSCCPGRCLCRWGRWARKPG